MQQRISLRGAREEDLEFLFEVSTEAMRPVVELLHPEGVPDRTEEFRRYKERFNPEKIQVIQYDGKDVGRLRVVRFSASIYVGGIQILPEFQNKGIGNAIFAELLAESKRKRIPIILEVHDVNTRARAFYKKFDFKEIGREENVTILKTIIE